MRKFIKQLLLFLIIAFFSYLLILYIWGTFLPQSFNKNLRFGISSGYLKERLKEADTIKNIDILIVGSSHAYRGYDTRIFNKNGLKAFNLGSSAQTPIQTDLLLNFYLKKLNPKMVLYDIYPEVFDLDGVESTLDLISNYDNINRELFQMALKTKNIKVYNTLFFGLTQNHSSVDSHFIKSETILNGKYISGGYVQFSNQSVAKKNYHKTKSILLEEQLTAFNKSINLLKSKNIPVVFIQSPLRKNFYNSISNNKEIDDYFKSKSNYYNFNTLAVCKDEFFADERHLNQDGVNFFNESLFKKIDFKKMINKY